MLFRLVFSHEAVPLIEGRTVHRGTVQRLAKRRVARTIGHDPMSVSNQLLQDDPGRRPGRITKRIDIFNNRPFRIVVVEELLAQITAGTKRTHSDAIQYLAVDCVDHCKLGVVTHSEMHPQGQRSVGVSPMVVTLAMGHRWVAHQTKRGDRTLSSGFCHGRFDDSAETHVHSNIAHGPHGFDIVGRHPDHGRIGPLVAFGRMVGIGHSPESCGHLVGCRAIASESNQFEHVAILARQRTRTKCRLCLENTCPGTNDRCSWDNISTGNKSNGERPVLGPGTSVEDAVDEADGRGVNAQGFGPAKG